jgi:hypothetical protein
MNLFIRRICLAAVAIIFFILICNPVLVLAGDCVQKRETPQAPSKIYKQTNPLEVTPEIISAGKKLYTKGAKPLACFQCHGINKFLP